MLTMLIITEDGIAWEMVFINYRSADGSAVRALRLRQSPYRKQVFLKFYKADSAQSDMC